MQIEIRSIKDIQPYEHNPRNNDGAVDAVAASIKEFGWQQPIVVDKDGVIIAGHTRYKAAKKLKLKEVPVVVADNLTDEKVKAYRLADNKTSELAEWDSSALDKELAELSDFDMSQFGFDPAIFPDAQEVVEDDYEEAVPEEPKSKLGDIYQLGRHLLMCGDSTDAESVQKLCQGGKSICCLPTHRTVWIIQAKQKMRSKFKTMRHRMKLCAICWQTRFRRQTA